MCNVSTQAVSKWERGESIPDIEILERLSILYKLSINEIIGGEKVEVYMDIDKRRNIIYLTTSILVFVAYLFNFIHTTAEEGYFISSDIEFIMKGYYVIFNGTYGIAVYLSWIVFVILISHLIIRIYLMTKVIIESENLKRYLSLSMITVIIISIICIFIPVFYLFPQFIIILAMSIQLSANNNIETLRAVRKDLKEYKENYKKKNYEKKLILSKGSNDKLLLKLSRISVIIGFLAYFIFALLGIAMTIIGIIDGNGDMEFILMSLLIVTITGGVATLMLILYKYIGSTHTKRILFYSGILSSFFLIYMIIMLGFGYVGEWYWIILQYSLLFITILIPLTLFYSAYKLKNQQ